MSNFIKFVASFLILIIISISLYFFVYKSNLDIKAVKFISSNLELRFTKELQMVNQELAMFLQKSVNNLDEFADGVGGEKFANRMSLRQVNVENEQRLAEIVMQKERYLHKIKVVGNGGELFFSTDSKERTVVRSSNNVLFSSIDAIEKNNLIFHLSKENIFIHHE